MLRVVDCEPCPSKLLAQKKSENGLRQECPCGARIIYPCFGPHVKHSSWCSCMFVKKTRHFPALPSFRLFGVDGRRFGHPDYCDDHGQKLVVWAILTYRWYSEWSTTVPARYTRKAVLLMRLHSCCSPMEINQSRKAKKGIQQHLHSLFGVQDDFDTWLRRSKIHFPVPATKQITRCCDECIFWSQIGSLLRVFQWQKSIYDQQHK